MGNLSSKSREKVGCRHHVSKQLEVGISSRYVLERIRCPNSIRDNETRQERQIMPVSRSAAAPTVKQTLTARALYEVQDQSNEHVSRVELGMVSNMKHRLSHFFGCYRNAVVV